MSRDQGRVSQSQPLSLSGAGLNAEGLDCQIAETVCRRPRRSGRANVKASIGGCLCLRTLIRIPTRGLGFLVSLVTCRMQRSVHAKVSSSEFTYRKGTEIFGQAAPAGLAELNRSNRR